MGTNSFAGSILNAVGAPKYSEFIADLNVGNVLLVIDAFDEAKMQEKGIFFNALSRMDTVLMNPAFLDFCRWADSSN